MDQTIRKHWLCCFILMTPDKQSHFNGVQHFPIVLSIKENEDYIRINLKLLLKVLYLQETTPQCLKKYLGLPRYQRLQKKLMCNDSSFSHKLLHTFKCTYVKGDRDHEQTW